MLTFLFLFYRTYIGIPIPILCCVPSPSLCSIFPRRDPEECSFKGRADQAWRWWSCELWGPRHSEQGMGRDVSFRSVHPPSFACPFMDRYSWSSVRVEPKQRLFSPEHKRDTSYYQERGNLIIQACKNSCTNYEGLIKICELWSTD